MTDEELKAEIKRRYPVGTRVNSTGGNKNELVNQNDKVFWDGNHFRINGDCALYRKDREEWAVVVKAVEPQVINQYEIY